MSGGEQNNSVDELWSNPISLQSLLFPGMQHVKGQDCMLLDMHA